MYAKDNAVSALGKVIKYQSHAIDLVALISTWLSLLPLKHDLDESKVQNEFFAEMLATNPVLLLG